MSIKKQNTSVNITSRTKQKKNKQAKENKIIPNKQTNEAKEKKNRKK